MTRDEIIQANPLVDYLAGRGIVQRNSGQNLITNVCAAVEHKRGHLCVTIRPDKDLWHCNDCGIGGSIIDWIMHERGVDVKTAMESLDTPPPVRSSTPPKLIEAYSYTDETGKLLYQVCRYEPKTFKQRQPDGDGWIWGLEGITRVPYNLPEVLMSQTVVIVEGEKDCLTLKELGWVATTSAGGSSGWLPAYASFFQGKDVIVIPDTDTAGEKYAEAVLASLDARVASLKRVALPPPYKDVSDYVAGFADLRKAKLELGLLIESTPHTIAPLPVYSLVEMETNYREFVRQLSERSFDLGKFLPGLGQCTRHLVPGELVLIIANTGVGKSCLCQSIARAASPLPTLFFELELPLPLMFERFVQMEIGCFAHEVENDYRNYDVPLASRYSGLQHIWVCPESGLSSAQIESFIERSQLKIGKRPALVLVDYIGLVRDGGRSRYEMISTAAEQLKVIAKRTETIIVMASQISRPPKDKKESLEVHLHDAKESGSLENSAGLVLGCWRPEKSRIVIKVLKNTKGSSGNVIEADFDGAKMQITEARGL